VAAGAGAEAEEAYWEGIAGTGEERAPGKRCNPLGEGALSITAFATPRVSC